MALTQSTLPDPVLVGKEGVSRVTAIPLALSDSKTTTADKIPFAPNPYRAIGLTTAIGGDSGSPFGDVCAQTNSFDHIDWTPGVDLFVQEFRVWWSDEVFNINGINAIQVKCFNGWEGPVHGTKTGHHETLTLQRGEKIVECTLWGNGQGTRCGRIRLKVGKVDEKDVTKHRVFEVGKTPSDGQASYPQSVFGGYLLGAFGNSGYAIDNLGFFFLKPTDQKRCSVTQMKYQDPDKYSAWSSVHLDGGLYDNSSRGKRWDWSIADSQSISTSWSLEQSTATTIGVTLSMSATIEEIVQIGANFSWQEKETTTETTTVNKTYTETWNFSGYVPPYQKLQVSIDYQQGVIKGLPYKSFVELNSPQSNDNENWSWGFWEEGHYSGVAASDVIVTTKNV